MANIGAFVLYAEKSGSLDPMEPLAEVSVDERLRKERDDNLRSMFT